MCQPVPDPLLFGVTPSVGVSGRRRQGVRFYLPASAGADHVSRFGKSPEKVLFNPRLTDRAARVYAALAYHHSARTRQCNPSQAQICAQLNISDDTFRRAIAELVFEHVVIRNYEPGRQTEYVLPDLLDSDAAPRKSAGSSPRNSEGITPRKSAADSPQICGSTPRKSAVPPLQPPSSVGVEQSTEQSVQRERDTNRVHYSVDQDPDFVPDPAFSPNDLMAVWRAAKLPLPRSIDQLTQEDALRRLHHNPPHWPAAQIRQAIDKLIADHRGQQALRWAWKDGPSYLARQKPGETQGIEKVLAWEAFGGNGRGGDQSDHRPDAIDEIVERGRRRRAQGGTQ